MDNSKSQKLEKVAPACFWGDIKARCESLEAALKQLEAKNTGKEVPTIYTSRSNNVDQYYYQDKSNTGKLTRHYISKRNINEIKDAIQNEYNHKVMRNLKAEINALQGLIKLRGKTEHTYDAMPSAKTKLITPLTLSTDQYTKNWLSVEYQHKGFEDCASQYFTQKGLRVRSKSEIIIASILDRLQIPYRYEYPIKLNRYTVYPDFYCLNVRTRKEYIWEHFGMMGDHDYSLKTTDKMQEYAQNGYFPGKNMIVTFESSSKPLTPTLIESQAKAFLA